MYDAVLGAAVDLNRRGEKRTSNRDSIQHAPEGVANTQATALAVVPPAVGSSPETGTLRSTQLCLVLIQQFHHVSRLAALMVQDGDVRLAWMVYVYKL